MRWKFVVVQCVRFPSRIIRNRSRDGLKQNVIVNMIYWNIISKKDTYSYAKRN